jgi:hypothetical protein
MCFQGCRSICEQAITYSTAQFKLKLQTSALDTCSAGLRGALVPVCEELTIMTMMFR